MDNFTDGRLHVMMPSAVVTDSKNTPEMFNYIITDKETDVEYLVTAISNPGHSSYSVAVTPLYCANGTIKCNKEIMST